MYRDFFKLGVSNIRKRRIRSWLTMLGIIVGIAAVVSLVSLGQGLQKYIDDEFEKLGRDKIIITPRGSFYGLGGTSIELSDKDVTTIKKVKGVSDAVGLSAKPIRLEYRNQVRYYLAFGIPTDERRKLVDELFLSYDVGAGRNLREGDNYKVVLGHYFSNRNLFTPNPKLGDKIKINDIDFQIIGFFEPIGNPDDDVRVYIHQDTLKEMYGMKDDYMMILAKAERGQNMDFLVERIEKELRKSRSLKEGQEDFTVQSFGNLMDSYNNILLIVQIVITGIAAISLLVGGIGIMNTMYTAVLERTKEIGIMKAIGAKNADIMILFLIESGILGLAGGVIGVAIGVGFSTGIEVISTAVLETKLLQAYFPWYLILGSLVFSFLVGSISGLLPAIQASKLKPADALRYE